MTVMSAVVARRTVMPAGASTDPVSEWTRGIGIA